MKTEIEIDEIISDEYTIVGDGETYGSFPSIDEAVKCRETGKEETIVFKSNHMKIRHKFTAYIDKEVDCSELIEKKTENVK